MRDQTPSSMEENSFPTNCPNPFLEPLIVKSNYKEYSKVDENKLPISKETDLEKKSWNHNLCEEETQKLHKKHQQEESQNEFPQPDNFKGIKSSLLGNAQKSKFFPINGKNYIVFECLILLEDRDSNCDSSKQIKVKYEENIILKLGKKLVLFFLIIFPIFTFYFFKK